MAWSNVSIKNLRLEKNINGIKLIYEDDQYQPFEVLSWSLDMMKLKDQGTGLKYEDIKVGDWVGVVTNKGDIDLERFGEVIEKLEKCNYELMRVIRIKYYSPPAFGPKIECWAPKELVKLSKDQVDFFINRGITDIVRNYRTFKEVK